MFHYVSAGLAVRSDLPLPGLVEVPRAAAEPDIEVRSGAVPDRLDGAGETGPNWQRAGDALLVRVPGVIRMRLTGGRTMLYASEGPDPAAEAIWLSGTGLGLLHHQRGRVALRASAVRVGDAAILFCGPSGAGKSTLAAALAQAGHPLVADDLCCLALRDDALPLVHPDGATLMLWDHAIEGLSLAGRRGARVRPAVRKYHVAPPARETAALALGGIYLLREARPPHAAGIQPADIPECGRLLRDNGYRPLLVRRLGQRPRYFEAAVALARRARAFFLTRPVDLGRLPETVALLEAHWRAAGLGRSG